MLEAGEILVSYKSQKWLEEVSRTVVSTDFKSTFSSLKRKLVVCLRSVLLVDSTVLTTKEKDINEF